MLHKEAWFVKANNILLGVYPTEEMAAIITSLDDRAKGGYSLTKGRIRRWDSYGMKNLSPMGR